MPSWSTDETTDPLYADKRNFYKVESRTRGGAIDRLLYAGTNLDKAREIFRGYDPATAAYQADHQAANARAGGSGRLAKARLCVTI